MPPQANQEASTLSTREVSEVQEKIRNWLTEEGYEVNLEDDRKSFFHLTTHFPELGVLVRIFQPLDSKDHIVVGGRIDFSEDAILKLQALLERERENFVADLEFMLMAIHVQFKMTPDAHNPTGMIISRNIWYDGLTKDRFMTTMLKIYSGIALLMMKFWHRFAPQKRI